MFVGCLSSFSPSVSASKCLQWEKNSIQKDSEVFVPLCLPAMYIDQGLAMLQAIGVRLARHIFLTGAIGAEEVKAIVQGVRKSFEIFQGFVPGETALKGMLLGDHQELWLAIFRVPGEVQPEILGIYGTMDAGPRHNIGDDPRM